MKSEWKFYFVWAPQSFTFLLTRFDFLCLEMTQFSKNPGNVDLKGIQKVR